MSLTPTPTVTLPTLPHGVYGCPNAAKWAIQQWADQNNFKLNIGDKVSSRVVCALTRSVTKTTVVLFMKPTSDGLGWFVVDDDTTPPPRKPLETAMINEAFTMRRVGVEDTLAVRLLEMQLVSVGCVCSENHLQLGPALRQWVWQHVLTAKEIHTSGTVVGDILDSTDYWHQVETDADGKVTHLLFGRHDSWTGKAPKALLVDLSIPVERAPMKMVCFLSETQPLAFGFIDDANSSGYKWLLDGLAGKYHAEIVPMPEVVVSSESDICMKVLSETFPRADLRLWHTDVLVNIEKRYRTSITTSHRFVQYLEKAELTNDEAHWHVFMSSWEGVLRSTNDDELATHWAKIYDEIALIYPEVGARCEKWMAENLKYLVDCFSERSEVVPDAQTLQSCMKGAVDWLLPHLMPGNETDFFRIVANVRDTYEWYKVQAENC